MSRMSRPAALFSLSETEWDEGGSNHHRYRRMHIRMQLLSETERNRRETAAGWAVSTKENQNETAARNGLRADYVPSDTETGISDDETETTRTSLRPLVVLGDGRYAWFRWAEWTKTEMFHHRGSTKSVHVRSVVPRWKYQIGGTSSLFDLLTLWSQAVLFFQCRHLFSHIDKQYIIYYAQCSQDTISTGTQFQWLTEEELQASAISTAMKKVKRSSKKVGFCIDPIFLKVFNVALPEINLKTSTGKKVTFAIRFVCHWTFISIEWNSSWLFQKTKILIGFAYFCSSPLFVAKLASHSQRLSFFFSYSLVSFVS